MGSIQRQHNSHIVLRGEQHGLQRASISSIFRPVVERSLAARLGHSGFFLGDEVITSIGNGTSEYESHTLDMVGTAMRTAIRRNQSTFSSLDLSPDVTLMNARLTNTAPRLAVLTFNRQVEVDPEYFAAGFEILAQRTNDILAETTKLQLPTHK
jgi:hypothetical protein